MEKVVLQARSRTAGRHAVRGLRNEHQVPAVIYGAQTEPRAVAVDSRELHKALVTAGAGLISLEVEGGEPVQVLAREVQRHPVKHYALHVDFQAVAMNERLRLEVPLLVEGHAPALSHGDVVMIRNLDTVEIECLPQYIPAHIACDISGLTTVDDSIYLRDLIAPEQTIILGDPDQVVISLTMSSAGTAEEVAEEGTEQREVEVVSKGRIKEEEEG